MLLYIYCVYVVIVLCLLDVVFVMRERESFVSLENIYRNDSICCFYWCVILLLLMKFDLLFIFLIMLIMIMVMFSWCI